MGFRSDMAVSAAPAKVWASVSPNQQPPTPFPRSSSFGQNEFGGRPSVVLIGTHLYAKRVVASTAVFFLL